MVSGLRWSAAVLAALVTTGCVLAPRGTQEERLRAAHAGGAWHEPDPARRPLPTLSETAGWRELLAHACLANGELEAAWLDWRAAVERVDQAATYPNSNLSLGYEYMFSDENLKAWDRTTLSVGIDPMQNLAFPTKVVAAGRVALDQARAAGDRFAAMKFELQRKVLVAWLEWTLTAERGRLAHESRTLLGVARDAAARALATGGMQADLLEAETARILADDELARRDAELVRQRMALNALVGRPADAPLRPPVSLPSPRPRPSDAEILAAGTRGNAELSALAHDVAERHDALDLAWQQLIPDVNPFAGLTGSIERVAGAMASLPIRVPMLVAGIHEARMLLQRAQASARQIGLERDATFLATLVALRDAERQAALLESRVLPLAGERVRALRTVFTTGEVPLRDLIAGERMLVELRMLLAEARVARETQLAELEALAGVDVEAITARRARDVDAAARGVHAVAAHAARAEVLP